MLRAWLLPRRNNTAHAPPPCAGGGEVDAKVRLFVSQLVAPAVINGTVPAGAGDDTPIDAATVPVPVPLLTVQTRVTGRQ